MMKHHSVAPLKSIPRIRRTFSAISIILSFVFALAAFGVQQGTSWTYQGQLRRSGAAYNGTCNFQFSLWDAASAGTQQGSTQAINSVKVVNGLFTAVLDFGDQFDGEARWLGTSVQCGGDGGFTPLDPRQPITAAPYALSLRPGARIEGSNDFESMLMANNAGGGFGIIGSGKIGLFGSTILPGGSGVYGQGGAGANSAGVFGLNTNSAAIWGRSTGGGSAIFGENLSTGYAGRFIGPVSVEGALAANTLVANNTSSGGTGVDGRSFTGVYGQSTFDQGIGVFGDARNVTLGIGVQGMGRTGVYGESGSSQGFGVWARTTHANGYALIAENTSTGWAAQFKGFVQMGGSASVSGNLTVYGKVLKQSGDFRIDHPLDPANKFLSHSFVESPDMKNIYDGNVTTDATGRATVMLPDYFEVLNRDFRYQLTVLGQFAQAIVSREIADNSFEIHTDKPGVKVSWQVTGIRQDAFARANPIVVEEFKPAEERGMYMFPAGFGAGEEKQIGAPSRPATPPGAQEPPATRPGDQALSN